MIPVVHDGRFVLTCPATLCYKHHIPIEGSPKWNWNGSLDRPTLTPSVRVVWKYGENPEQELCCHFNLTDGVIHFSADCTHEFAGKSVDIKDVLDKGE